MNAKSAYRYLLLTFVAGIGLSAWIVRYASIQLASTSTELVSLHQDIANLEHRRDSIEKAEVVLADNSDTVATLSKVVPDDKNQATVVSELYAIADKAGISIDSVGFPASTLGSQPAKPTASSTSTNTTPSGGTVSTSPSIPQTSISQATPLKDIPGVQSIALSIGAINSKSLPAGSGVRYSEMMSFIRQLERNERAIQITALGIGQDKVVNGEATFSLTISLTIFVKS